MLAGTAEQADLLIADVQLGRGASGLDAVARVLQQLGHAVPVILVTGDTDPRRVREAFAAGHGLLFKPLDTAQGKTITRRPGRAKRQLMLNLRAYLLRACCLG